MPIYQKIVFVCSKCGYREVRHIGDVRPYPNELKPCPKCRAIMKPIKDKPNIKDNIFSSIKEILRR